jgi:twinkle protein
MSLRFDKTHNPCPSCGSSDAYCSNTDGSTKCFSCGKFVPSKRSKYEGTDNTNLFSCSPPDNWRGIKESTARRYDVRWEVADDGSPVRATFSNKGLRTKARYLGDDVPHDRRWVWLKGEGKTQGVFGKEQFERGSAPAITITEGHLDALSVYQMFGSKYPAVSVQSSSSAKSDLAADFDYINSFQKIYFSFDNDEPGHKAIQEAISLFDPRKCYVVKLDKYKDANEYLANGCEKQYVKLWWNAEPFKPSSIISSFRDIQKLIKEYEQKPSISYPFPILNDMAHGMREGEVVLLTAFEGIGKTEIVRAIEYHTLTNTDLNIGSIHIEEDPVRSVQGLVSLFKRRPVHLGEKNPLSNAELVDEYEKLCKGVDNRVNFYNHFGSEDPDVVLNDIRFMVSANSCKLVALDHISLVISGITDSEERIRLDNLSTKLKELAKELGFTLLLVSHVNDDGKTRGSRNISKIADLWVHLDRDPEHPNPKVRNTTKLIVKKNRFGAVTGLADELYFDKRTFCLSSVNPKINVIKDIEKE